MKKTLLNIAQKVLDDPTVKLSELVKKTGLSESGIYRLRVGQRHLETANWTTVSAIAKIKNPSTESHKDLEKVKALLNDKDVLAIDIFKNTGVAKSSISNYRLGKMDINLSSYTAVNTLAQYANQLKKY